ncbi:MAG: hypothetical protein JRI68_27375 [Deltaproteobacteria bacterium]|nr:hypothetical protein [Deltaproteobacteria bacterium]
MSASDRPKAGAPSDSGSAQWRDVPIDWEALEDAFENNAPEVHSYLHVPTGDVLRIVDGIADPQMHARIAADPNYLRIEPVSSREQYRWMERYIPMVDNKELQARLTRAIDGKGAFRRFKDVLMSFGPERERWFAFRSERLRIFMEAWLNAHALNPVRRPVWVPEMVDEGPSKPQREPANLGAGSADALRHQVRDLIEGLAPRDLDHLAAFAEFLRARAAAGRQSSPSQPEAAGMVDALPQPEADPSEPPDDEDNGPSSAKVPATRQVASGD